MKKLYYMNYYQDLGEKTRKYAEGLVVSDEEIKVVVQFSVDGETLTCTALVLNDVEDIYYLLQDLILRGKTTNMKTKKLQTLALREFLNDEQSSLYEILCKKVQYGITNIQNMRAIGHTFFELDDYYSDKCRKNNSSSIVEFAHRHHATDYYIALNDDLLNIEAILNDEDVAL